MHFINNGIGIVSRPSTGQLYSRTCFRPNHPQRCTTGIAARETSGFPAKGGREENPLGIRMQKDLCRIERMPLVWVMWSRAVYPRRRIGGFGRRLFRYSVTTDAF